MFKWKELIIYLIGLVVFLVLIALIGTIFGGGLSALFGL